MFNLLSEVMDDTLILPGYSMQTLVKKLSIIQCKKSLPLILIIVLSSSVSNHLIYYWLLLF